MSSIVVADAGPLHYLVLIDCGEILGNLFHHVLVPFAVRDELVYPRAPQKVKDWIVQGSPLA
jgi:predicted nucleic acid-binding protein